MRHYSYRVDALHGRFDTSTDLKMTTVIRDHQCSGNLIDNG